MQFALTPTNPGLDSDFGYISMTPLNSYQGNSQAYQVYSFRQTKTVASFWPIDLGDDYHMFSNMDYQT